MRIHLPRLGLAGEDHLLPAITDCLTATGLHDIASPADADIILYPQCHFLGDDWRLDAITRDPIARQWPDKVFVYDERDRPWGRYPGVFVSMPSTSFNPTWQVASGYYLSTAPTFDPDITQDLLFSFIGSPSAPVRESIYALQHPRAVVERIDGFVFYDPSSTKFAERKATFADLMGRSRFVLCPRGWGVNSIRLYETLAAGRIPVIISDDWVPSKGPDWDSFSVRWPENAVADLPRYLESIEERAHSMARSAREAYTTWFAPGVQLARAVEDLRPMLDRRSAFPSGGLRGLAWRQSLAHRLRNDVRRHLRPLVRVVRGSAGSS